jgi:hypothetical protein
MNLNDISDRSIDILRIPDEGLHYSTMSAPESTLPYPPAHKNKKFVALSDWSVHFPIPVFSASDSHEIIGMARLPPMIQTIVRRRSST